jgi:hypothetical protein
MWLTLDVAALARQGRRLAVDELGDLRPRR